MAAKQLNKLLSLLLCALLSVLMCTDVLASSGNRCHLVIDYRRDGIAISNAAFRLYRVADLNTRGELVYTGAFSDLDLDPEQLRNAQEALYGRVDERNLRPEQILTTNGDGEASAANLPSGVFLLVCDPTEVEDYVYYMDMQVIFLEEGTLTVCPKTTRLPVGERLISIQAVKVWDDHGDENKRPREITVRLLKDGKTVRSAVLSEANGWSHTWNDLLPNARWTVEENIPDGYLVTVERTDHVFTLTNQYKNIPQTGQIWWPILTILGIGMLLVIIGLTVRRSGRNEE